MKCECDRFRVSLFASALPVSSERFLSAAARRTRPVILSDMSLSAAGLEDVLATYSVCFRVSECRQSVGRLGWGAALWHPAGACPKKASLHKGLLVELRNYDVAVLEFCKFLRFP